MMLASRLRRRGEVYAGLLTPIFKGFTTENGVEVASLGIQVHGGMGYIEETGAAQHWRDARIPPIYEGTNGIQAIDLVTRKVAPDGGASMQALIAECRAMLAPVAPLPSEMRLALAPAADLASACLNDLAAATEWLIASKRDPDERLYAATPYLRLTAIALCASLLIKGAVAAVRMENANGAAAASAWPRIGLAALFADEFGAEAPGLFRRIAAPLPTPALRTAALDLER